LPLDQLPIHFAQKTDLADIHQLEKTIFGEPCYPAFFFRQAFDCWPKGLLVAKQDSSLLGYLLWVESNAQAGDAWILSLAVATQARGKGIARGLINHAIATARGESNGAIKRLLLTVAPKNLVALSLYQSMEFIILTNENDYFSPGEARLILALKL
jgi:ribosomal-protein-alanine N-acetyltransferase